MKKNKKEMIKQKSLFTGWEIFLLLILALVSKGLFVENQIFPFSIVISIVLLFMLIYKLLTKQDSMTLPHISIAFLLIAVSYIPSFINAESFEYTLTKMIEWSTYALVLLLFHKYILSNISTIILAFSSFFALAHFFLLHGFISIQDGIMLLGEGLSGSGIRLAGFLQYPNATATIIGALILYVIQHYIISEESNVWRIIQFTTFLLLGYLLLMTESRWAWLVFGLSFMFSLTLVRRTKQVLYILYMCILMVFGLITYSLSSAFLSVNNLGMIVGCSIFVGAVVISIVLEKFKISVSFEPKSRYLIPAFFPSLLIAVGLFALKFELLPNALQSRLTTNLGTFSDRFVYMKDGFAAIQDNFLFGAGGEAWRFKMYQVQSAPYIVQDMHNFFLQHWLEVGLIGTLILFFALLTAVVVIWRENRLLLPPILMIIIHAIFDFTLSYGFTLLLLAIFIIEGMGEKSLVKIQRKSIKQTYTAISIVVAICCVTLSTFWIQAESLFNKGIQTQNVNLIEQAMEKNPFATRYMLWKYPHSSTTEQVELMETVLTYEPHHALALFQLAESEYELGKFENAIIHFEQALEYDHFDRQKYEKTITYLQVIQKNDEQLREPVNKLRLKIESNWEFYEDLAESNFIRDQRSFLED